jgi:hypothetical protein
MSWERRGVAAAVVTPLTVVSTHALCTLQAAWFGPSIVGAAAALVLPIVAAGVANWIKPAVATASRVEECVEAFRATRIVLMNTGWPAFSLEPSTKVCSVHPYRRHDHHDAKPQVPRGDHRSLSRGLVAWRECTAHATVRARIDARKT